MYSKLFVIALITLLAACSHVERHQDEPNAQDLDGVHVSHAPHTSHPSPLNLSLNGDKKWLMDAHTRTVTSEMANRFSSLDLEQQSRKELAHLGDHLSQDLDHLIRGCKMEGDAHNALHNFLAGFMPALEELKTTGSVDSAKQLEQLLTEYNQYFE